MDIAYVFFAAYIFLLALATIGIFRILHLMLTEERRMRQLNRAQGQNNASASAIMGPNVITVPSASVNPNAVRGSNVGAGLNQTIDPNAKVDTSAMEASNAVAGPSGSTNAIWCSNKPEYVQLGADIDLFAGGVPNAAADYQNTDPERKCVTFSA